MYNKLNIVEQFAPCYYSGKRKTSTSYCLHSVGCMRLIAIASFMCSSRLIRALYTIGKGGTEHDSSDCCNSPRR